MCNIKICFHLLRFLNVLYPNYPTRGRYGPLTAVVDDILIQTQNIECVTFVPIFLFYEANYNNQQLLSECGIHRSIYNMDSIIRLASSLSNIEDFARDIYIKSNLTIELDQVVKKLIEDNGSNYGNDNRILMETPTVSLLCDILEAILLHGIKEKLSSRMSNVFGGNSSQKNSFSLDFWPIVTILCHNEESRHLRELSSISTDIGRCRAWLRSSLNESLFRSYFDALICDSSLLNSFYRSSAYIRDSQHTEIMRQLIIDMERYIFHLSIDNVDLNCWSSNTLKFLGISIAKDDSLVVTALDAIHLINEDGKHSTNVSTM